MMAGEAQREMAEQRLQKLLLRTLRTPAPAMGSRLQTGVLKSNFRKSQEVVEASIGSVVRPQR